MAVPKGRRLMLFDDFSNCRFSSHEALPFYFQTKIKLLINKESMDKIEIICLRTDAFYTLFEQVLNHFGDKQKDSPAEKWISGPEAMKMLRIKSRATLQKLRDEGKIRYSQPEKKIILYDVESIHAYLDDFVYEPFDLPKSKR